MRKIYLVVALTILFLSSQAQVKILFDATKAETASNADWVVDADLYNLGYNSTGAMVTGAGNEANPQRIPTLAQSGITATTSETYWKGALSNWGIDLARRGYTIETLPYNGQITYGVTTNAQDLSNYKVFIMDEPNIKFTTAEKTALMNFVQNGGGLFMIADHAVSDRNNDGWDSPMIFNDFFSTNSVKVNPFGITFDAANFSQTTSNVLATTTNAILKGPAGTVTGLQFSNGNTMTLNRTANSTAKGLIFKTSSSTTGTTNAMFAVATYGNGRVCGLGDSSVPDDGTGDVNDALYSSYATSVSGSHQKLLINAVLWLAGATSGVKDVASDYSTAAIQPRLAASVQGITVYPNPANDRIVINGFQNQDNAHLSLLDMTGRIVLDVNVSIDNGSVVYELNRAVLPAGIYLMNISAGDDTQMVRLVLN